MHRAKEVDREGYREREREETGERDGEWERDPHNLQGEASTDHPKEEGLG